MIEGVCDELSEGVCESVADELNVEEIVIEGVCDELPVGVCECEAVALPVALGDIDDDCESVCDNDTGMHISNVSNGTIVLKFKCMTLREEISQTRKRSTPERFRHCCDVPIIFFTIAWS